MQRAGLSLPGALLLLPAIAAGQAAVGFGQEVFAIDVQAKTTAALAATWTKFVGAARDKNGNYWAVSGHPTANTPGKIVKFDAAGNFVKAIDQPSYAITDFAIRDLAYDGNNTIYGGLETPTSVIIAAFDIVTETWDTNTSGKAWAAPSGTTVVRGLAFDPLGNSGQGSMFTTNFSFNPVIEFRKDGTVLRQIPISNFGTGAAPYGLAVDMPGRKLWAFSQGGSSHTNYTAGTGYNVLIEISLATGQETKTGLMTFGSMAGGLPNSPYVTPIAGGCELVTHNGKKSMLCLNQAGSDSIAIVDLEYSYGPGCGGNIAMTGDGPYAGNTSWGVELRNTLSTQAILMLGIGQASTPLPPAIAPPGCNLLLPSVLYLFPSSPVVGGVAVTTVPIPLGVNGVVNFQWIEPSATILPVRVSDAAKVLVGHK